MSEWIHVPNWGKFQHYKDGRKPVWIKLYLELQHRDEWLDLTYAQRGLLVCIWLEYAASGGRLKVERMSSRLGAQVDPRTLEALKKAGFVVISSRPEVEVDIERPSELSKPRKNEAPELLTFDEYLERLKR